MKSNRQKNIHKKIGENPGAKPQLFARCVLPVIKQMPYRAGLSHSEIFRHVTSRILYEWNLILTRSFQIVLNVSCSTTIADIYCRIIIRTGGAIRFDFFHKNWVKWRTPKLAEAADFILLMLHLTNWLGTKTLFRQPGLGDSCSGTRISFFQNTGHTGN